MRIIAGRAKGTLLKQDKKEKKVRPTTDRLKESLFNCLRNENPCNVLDLFAGFGSLGLEALSRYPNCKNLYFVDSYYKSCKIIKQNIAIISELKDLLENCKVLNQDSFQALKKLKNSSLLFDLVFADPPYNKGICQKIIHNEDLLAITTQECLLVIEHHKDEGIPTNKFWEIIKTLQFSDKVFSIMKKLTFS